LFQAYTTELHFAHASSIFCPIEYSRMFARHMAERTQALQQATGGSCI